MGGTSIASSHLPESARLVDGPLVVYHRQQTGDLFGHGIQQNPLTPPLSSGKSTVIVVHETRHRCLSTWQGDRFYCKWQTMGFVDAAMPGQDPRTLTSLPYNNLPSP